jgi:hypothetical protein
MLIDSPPFEVHSLLGSRNAATLGTALHLLGEGSRDDSPKCINARSIQQLRVTTDRSNQRLIRHDGEEVAGNLRPARVEVIESGRKDSWLAGRVELEVHLSLREQHAAVVLQRGVDLANRALGVVAVDVTFLAGVLLENEAADQAALDDGQELVGARVQVRRVEAAGVDEANGHGDVGADKSREDIHATEVDGAAGGSTDSVVDELVGNLAGVRAGAEEDLLTLGLRGCSPKRGAEVILLLGRQGREDGAARGGGSLANLDGRGRGGHRESGGG